MIGDEMYELNCSLPYLFGQGVSVLNRHRRIEIAVAISCFVSGWAFLYLPMLLGFMPEEGFADAVANGGEMDLEDPRTLNRTPMRPAIWRNAQRSSGWHSMRGLIEFMIEIRRARAVEGKAESILISGSTKNLLVIDRLSERLQLIVNVDSTRSEVVRTLCKGQLIEGRRANDESVGPLGFGFWCY
jgi:hypothetical protein